MPREAVSGEPLITIITSTYNAVAHLQDAIKSIREQSFRRFEWIIIDGASTDGTLKILHDNEDVIDRWISEPDRGIYDAWNKGLALAHGEWILFMGADDELAAPDVLQLAAQKLGNLDDGVHWAYGNVRQFGTNGRSQLLGEPWAEARKNFTSGMSVPHQGVFHRRSLFDRCGWFNPAYRIAGDYALLLRAFRSGFEPYYLTLLVAHMGGGGVSSRPEMTLVTIREFIVARREAGIRPACSLECWWGYCKAIVKFGLALALGATLLRKLVNAYRYLTRRPML